MQSGGPDRRSVRQRGHRLEDRIDASPAIVSRQLFLRGHEYLYCLAE